MIEHYALIKHLHMTSAALSLLLFVARAGGSVAGAAWLQARWARVLPHINDTLLLTLGVGLMVTLQLWPHQQPWLAAKLLALLAYIGLGTVAIKRGRRPGVRALAGGAAVAVFLYMVGAAVTHHPLSWLAWR